MTEIPEVVVISVSFIEDMVQVEFVEMRKQSDHVAHIESISVSRELIEEEVEELELAAREILDKAHVIQRNPPEIRQRGD